MKRRWVLVGILAILAGVFGDWAERSHQKESAMSSTQKDSSNRLAREKSPYLLQHAHNPVDWYAWGPEAFDKAKKEDKPIFLSIGYATCHWCHVMERESFESEEIARVMNENFVSIKVDREERPDVDQIYMNAVQGMTGSGGWPLSAFLNHELEPFWGGTYFPPESRYGRPGFKDILLEISRVWKGDRSKLIEAGREVGEALKKMDRTTSAPKDLSVETLRRAYAALGDIFDAREGGFGGAPKFPRSETIGLLLRIYRRTGEKRALHMATLTLEKMARGGIYDHLGGGFHRYATDEGWIVPHFEKMLYDNALLARAYLEASQVDGNPMWRGVARETLDYVLRDMTAPEGGFYSAEDADSEGEEGKFYVWTEEELKSHGINSVALTPEEFRKIRALFSVTAHGNFEGKNILTYRSGGPWEERYRPETANAMKKLLALRGRRVRPLRDDKVLASWNGLMIGTMARGFQVLGDERYLRSAQRAADFVLKTLWDGKTLKRRFREGDARFAGSLDDYSFFIAGLLDLYETDFDVRWFEEARRLQARVDALFWDGEGGYFFTDLSDASVIARSKDIYDGAVPSGNSVAAMNLLRLYEFTLEEGYRKKAETITRVFGDFVSSHPHASPVLLMAVDFMTDAAKQVVIAGVPQDPRVKAMLSQIHLLFLPNKVLALSDRPDRAKSIPLTEGKVPLNAEATIYVCEGNVCKKPATSLEDVKDLLKKASPYSLY